MASIPTIKPKRLTNSFAADTCKLGEGTDCCKYLTADINGLQCGKLNPKVKAWIDKTTHMVAKSDNCNGVEMRHE